MVRAPSSPPTKASSSDSFIYLLPRTAEHPGAPALVTLERPFRAITYLFAAEPALSALSASRGRSMLQGAPAPRTLWWKEVTGRRITIGHLYTIYMQDKLIHDRQPRSSGSLGGAEAGERLWCLCNEPAAGSRAELGSSLLCVPPCVMRVPRGSYCPSLFSSGKCCHTITACKNVVLDEVDALMFFLKKRGGKKKVKKDRKFKTGV